MFPQPCPGTTVPACASCTCIRLRDVAQAKRTRCYRLPIPLGRNLVPSARRVESPVSLGRGQPMQDLSKNLLQGNPFQKCLGASCLGIRNRNTTHCECPSRSSTGSIGLFSTGSKGVITSYRRRLFPRVGVVVVTLEIDSFSTVSYTCCHRGMYLFWLFSVPRRLLHV